MLDTSPPPSPWLVFLTGVLGLCCVQVLAPVGWALGNRYMRICLRQGLEPDPLARMGRVMGLIGTLVWGSLGFLALAGWLIAYAWTR
ncbi:MAG: hypothetical protein AB8H79_15005 [Myxococcota bacterium]